MVWLTITSSARPDLMLCATKSSYCQPTATVGIWTFLCNIHIYLFVSYFAFGWTVRISSVSNTRHIPCHHCGLTTYHPTLVAFYCIARQKRKCNLIFFFYFYSLPLCIHLQQSLQSEKYYCRLSVIFTRLPNQQLGVSKGKGGKAFKRNLIQWLCYWFLCAPKGVMTVWL